MTDDVTELVALADRMNRAMSANAMVRELVVLAARMARNRPKDAAKSKPDRRAYQRHYMAKVRAADKAFGGKRRW